MIQWFHTKTLHFSTSENDQGYQMEAKFIIIEVNIIISCTLIWKEFSSKYWIHKTR